VRPAALAQTAAERFVGGADAPFLACFDEQAEVYWEPAVAQRPIVSSRDSLAAWLARIRQDHPHLNVSTTEPIEHGSGAVLEVIVTRGDEPEEVWRVALAVCCEDELIREVRAFWSRDAAVEWVVGFR
jgi:hypothetical protein